MAVNYDNLQKLSSDRNITKAEIVSKDNLMKISSVVECNITEPVESLNYPCQKYDNTSKNVLV